MAYEDFTTFDATQDEGNDITVDSATKISWINFKTKNETGYCYKDYGAAHFSGDFTHQFEIFWSAAAGDTTCMYWGLWNTVNDCFANQTGDSGDQHRFYLFDDVENLYLQIVENGSGAGVDTWASPGPQISTLYYITIDRDDDGGANNTGQLVANIRTGSHLGVLRATLTADCSAGEQNDFRYVYMPSSYDDGTKFPVTTGYVQNLDLNKAVAGIPMFKVGEGLVGGGLVHGGLA